MTEITRDYIIWKAAVCVEGTGIECREKVRRGLSFYAAEVF